MQKDSEETIRIIRDKTDTILLAFSCGKDSIAAWLACKPHFPKIVPFYMYLVPDLEFVENSLKYYEQFFGTKIIRVPHPSLYRMIKNFVYQPPERCAVIEAARWNDFTYDDLHQALREDYNLPKETWVAQGVRAVDSPIRMTVVKKHGALNVKRKSFWPVWDWRIDRLINKIETAGVKLPIDYKYFGRSFDGLDYRFLKPIKEHFPKDFEQILKWFPLADLDIARREYAAQN